MSAEAKSDASQPGPEDVAAHPKKKGLSLSSKIVIGLCAGIFAGLFFGEMAEVLDIVGKAFVQLLQMAVLPYVFVSLIGGLGRLKLSDAKILAVKGGMLLLVTWVVAFFVILIAPLAFPDRESASFFSSSIVQGPQELDLLKLYIPSNPFYSLSNNLVPAVVLFSIALGIALIGIKDKDDFLSQLALLTAALTRVTGFVVQLTPYGVFAIAASAAGTMTLEEFADLQVYFMTYVGGTMLATLWILPGLVSALTPIRYLDVLRYTKDALLTAFSTGNLFVILPILAQNSKALFAKYKLEGRDTGALVDVILPVSFNFPNVGKLMMIVFVLFAAWFTGTNVPISQYPAFVVSALVTFFGSVNVAVPFLLDALQIPADMFQLFLVTTVVNTRFSTLLAAMHVLFLALAGTCAITGHLSFNLLRIGRFLAITAVLSIAFIVGSRAYLSLVVSQEYDKDRVIKSMQTSRVALTSEVHRELPEPLGATAKGRSRLDAVIDRGVIRVGYRKSDLPFTFFNGADELVGFGVDMASLLATDLGVGLEFVPVKRDSSLPELLDKGYIDIVMSSQISTPLLNLDTSLSRVYMEATLGFVVRDYRRDEFASASALRELEAPAIGIPSKQSFFKQLVHHRFPNAKVVVMDEPDAVEKFFYPGRGDLDAMAYPAEAGSAYTLLHPQFAVVVPLPEVVKLALVYPVPVGDARMVAFLDNWIDLRERDGTIQGFYDYWILGKNAVPREPRWSIIRDVLGLVD